MIEHRNVVRLLFNRRFQFDFNARDVWTLFHSTSFDFSVWEMYGALLYGGRLVVVPGLTAKDPNLFLELLKRESVTVLNQTPSAFYNLSRADLAGGGRQRALRYVIFGGEALTPAKLGAWLEKYPAVKLVNMFGITETTVHVTYKDITLRETRDNISNIGGPIPTSTTHIMDPGLKLRPVGAEGELCVGGDGVARGYLNRPELTAQRFTGNPYKPGERLYRSGDLGKRLKNGEMEYLGRIDSQVQLRGFRIEPGEIEARLATYPAVEEAVVLPGENRNGDMFLCAYIIAGGTEHGAWSAAELREYLSRSLPGYMIPPYFVAIDKIPLTPNGKLDRKALPEPGVTAEEDYVAPADEIETELVRIWGDVLEVERPGVTDNFFNTGGDSIKAIALLNAVNSVFNTTLGIPDLYLNQTVRD
jgi:surfactin family lipopeptide synthetase A